MCVAAQEWERGLGEGGVGEGEGKESRGPGRGGKGRGEGRGGFHFCFVTQSVQYMLYVWSIKLASTAVVDGVLLFPVVGAVFAVGFVACCYYRCCFCGDWVVSWGVSRLGIAGSW